MFDLPVFIVLSALTVAANIVAIPKAIAYSDLNRDTRSKRISTVSAVIKGILLSLCASTIGSYTAPRTGLAAPFFEAVAHFDSPHTALWGQLWPGLVSSLYVLLGLIILQIAFVHRHVSIARYYSMPLSAKILLEGLVEEVVYRWCLLSVIARILSVEFLSDPRQAMILAIVLSAVGSSLSHVSDLSRLNFDRLSMALVAILLVNFWGAICYGWLFWKFGLTAAILCHMVVVTVSVMVYKVRDFFALTAADGPR